MLIGVDGGGTHTAVVVLDSDNKVVGRGKSGSSNHFAIGLEQALAHITVAVDQALAAAGAQREEMSAWGFGLAGACTPVEQAAWQRALQPLAGARPVVVDEDAPAAQQGAFAGGPGAICNAGTGAISFGVDATGKRARADGLGPLLGDRGSGYWIGEQALRAAGRAFDQSGPATDLLTGVAEQLQASAMDQIVRRVYAADFNNERVAALARVVERCAAGGDAVAQEIIERAGAELAATATAVIKALNLDRVATVGGILRTGGPVRVAFAAALARDLPHVAVCEPQLEAAAGAALLAGK